MNSIIFLTGATGFLGTEISERLIKRKNLSLMILIRGKNYEDAYRHLKRAWWESKTLKNELEKIGNENSRITILNGDITHEQLGLDNEKYQHLTKNVTHIIHAAADLRLNIPMKELRKINVHGTNNVIEMAHEAHKHKLQKFSHVSTAYVAGGRTGLVEEDSISAKYGFKSNYEKSKYEGEVNVRNSDLPFTIFRPGMIVGDSKSGYIKTFNTIYLLMRLYLKGLKVLPVSKDQKINLVPVDYVADAICTIALANNTQGLTFHLTSPQKSSPTVKQLVNHINKWASENLDLKLPNPIFLPVSPIIPTFTKIFLSKDHGIGKILGEISPYLNEDRIFDTTNTEKFMGKYSLKWTEYLQRLLEFAVYNGFFHRSTRTVHEQILYRLASQSFPVNYYDIIDREYHHITPSIFNNDILKAIRALEAMGIMKGDKIAIAGFNSSRYLIIDVAIGLIGAVSVPIYYTSPIIEINEILLDSNAAAIFLGSPELLEHSEKLNSNIPVISFYRNYTPRPEILSWKEFLNPETELKIKKSSEISAPVDFNDIATIRYTSGTTGKPTGVCFNHGNLRWMAEFIASMPPWTDRTSHVNYLSFLPMNHVVEGILGTYSPYYAPASLKLYFLENFHDLETALPKVRPSIFFSVPRFYEKVWSKIRQSWLGNLYLHTSNNTMKGIYGKIMKNRVLKMTGLDACDQLIVGSAPISEELLESYNEMGIEIYNAYGLTEAPLITINRLGSNIIGTVGSPLPETELEIMDDGEVVIRGPQLSSGYYNNIEKNHQQFKDDWFLTGDYGYIEEHGSLVITGRKKELIVNSYGKSINPLKVEGMIKLIKGVKEVMMVGDQKPFCIAIIWIDETFDSNHFSNDLLEVNRKLSNPEKIRRWMAIKTDLSIENGDITANLKLKRNNILKSQEILINKIYDKNWMEMLKQDPESIYHGEVNDHEY